MRALVVAASLLAALTVAASSALAAPPKQDPAGPGSIGIRLLELPGASSAGSRARAYIVGRVAPGTTIRRRIEISNDTRSRADVAVYPAAASLRQGRFAFADSRSGNDLSTWTSVSRDVLHLASGTKALETVTIRVPKRASWGEHYAVVWAEVSAPSAAAGGVRLVNRVGIRIYLSVGPGGSAGANFVIGKPIARRSPDGEPLVLAVVRNTGGSTLDIKGELLLSDGPGELGAGPFPIIIRPALPPNRSATLRVALDKQLPRGPWRVQVRLESGLVKREAVAIVRFPLHAEEPTVKSVGGDSGPPYAVVIAALIVALATSVLLWLWRRPRFGRGSHRPAAADAS